MKKLIGFLFFYLTLTGLAHAQQCTASFTSTTSPGNPNLIGFTNTSVNLVQQFDSLIYFWDFGDGNFSSQTNPAHTYSGSGSYFVCLTMTVTDSSGILCVDSVCQTIIIPGVSCSANFIASPDPVNFSLLQFIDSSIVTNTSPGDSIIINWDFGDGTSSTTGSGVSIFHTYNSIGSFTVCMSLVVYDISGDSACSDVICKTVSSTPFNCAAGFTWSSDSLNPLSFTFIDTSNFMATGGSTDSIIWDFGDGTTAFGDTVQHTYTQNGTFTVCLQLYVNIFGSIICSDTICHNITILPDTDFCDIQYIIDTINSYNGVVYIWNLGDSLNPNTSNSYLWDFGDGSFSNQAYPAHVYSLTGSYNVCLTIESVNSNQDTCRKSFCDSIIVNPDGSLGSLGAGFTLNVLNPLTIGIGEIAVNEVQVYPNPASDFVKIDMGSNSQANIVEWHVYDIKGLKVLEGTINTKNQKIKRIDVSSLKSGIYLISIKDNSSVSQRKLKIIRW